MGDDAKVDGFEEWLDVGEFDGGRGVEGFV